MPTPLQRGLIAAILTSGFALAQPTLNLKTRRIDTSASKSVTEISSSRAISRVHLLLQFNQPPTPQIVATLKGRGATVLEDVPDNGLLVSVEGRVRVGDLGVRYAAPLDSADKISPLITSHDASAASGFFLVEFHPDVNLNQARGLLLNAGFELQENPDLSPQHLMIHSGEAATLSALAQLDEVGYIFPASRPLREGIRTLACGGALTTDGVTAQSIPTYGYGWDGPGLGSASLSYVFNIMTAQLPTAATQAEIERAMAEWSKAVKVTWTPSVNAYGNQTVNILWATYAHGDGFPFTGPGGILAHTFYPAPPNPEPIAGDMHFNDSETWHIGANIDLFSVALHELGHALGLGHSDNPAAVMYPYYQVATELSLLDTSIIQTMYATQDATPAPVPTPLAPSTALTLTVNVPTATTTAATTNLSGAVTGGKATIVVIWTTSNAISGAALTSGAAWTVSGVPLSMGANTITISATDGVSHVSQSLVVTRQAAPTTPDTTPPSLTIVSPSASTISTSAASIAFSGTATDNVGVTGVTWTTNTGGSGTALGSANWSATIPLLTGSNSVTIRASDAAGNVGWRSVVVSRQ